MALPLHCPLFAVVTVVRNVIEFLTALEILTAGPNCLPYIRSDGTPGIICRQPAASMPQDLCSPRNPQCSREGAQAEDDRGTGRLAGIAGDDCDKGSRDCFPADRTGLWEGVSVLMG